MRKMHCMIDVRKLEILRELDRCGTIAATAAAVHLTPSAVSQQLAALSKEAGTAMLEPDGRRVRLTEAAQLLLQHAHQIFTHLEHAESDLAAFRRGDAGTVRVGTFSSAVKALAVPLVSDLSTRTRIRVELREVQPEDALDALLGRRVDICMNLATTELLPGSDDKRVHSEHLLDDVMDVALPFDHPLADRAEIELADLADEDWILANPGVPCWQLSRDACERAGFSPRARHYADEFVGVVGLVAAGHGVSLLPRLAQPEAVHEPIVLRPVAGVSPVRRISVQTRAGTADQPHIAPALESLRRVAAGVARGPLACRSVTRGPAPIADPAPALVS
ncbi:transcriptional regulator, LysR family [Nakamurella multipartita DSM 44233]|uniref:Transcriptional regulator, LysR family n=2 Tax=Nakamurella TaxID=53460 RepID=C8XI45_NAKMY|nr:transcriptional regulator, LysR family [Nakamurella multipartita DSM 44233]